MKLLAIDTSSSYLSLALSLDNQLLNFHEEMGQKHAERTLPEIQRLLQQADIALTDLDAIVYGQGPGSFTGLRIACGLAQGLAFSAGLPLIGIPTLDAVAQQSAADQVLVCLDARMQQVYCASYQTGPAWQRLTPITLQDPQDVTLPDGITLLAGDGFTNYPALLPAQRGSTRHTGILRADARAHIELALSGRYPQQHPREAELLYVRNKVALTSLEQQALKG
ncbi:tRNA (adenosine(37)-N6)-threonylcarbamoyltransferase complex dimerization subunit type 1 TsaB [Aquitalea sp. LB_tupeE]|uniref:tRNA (adenosine(37)-N6)-threonylcarbamoyltransferase complex dimerization subunit type 1 TsaB n=1 Tax=Aquitalea sp. LB_tupeE TaxID=2748078 RepID=UPI0015BA4974|nr:tRNA (adenosine(37)-N6)-threonylcarbamoyltransferase complex dimerization subunit type 1 TsaB [Aquitalea sp. LB_tupeE]NWK78729.1 tRNA (adenosine(37)-N6)-threonylcarbamoyltransferase complex dimerization subunit type 1 TsaB [Aquitalea sp. LB_tupeE]